MQRTRLLNGFALVFCGAILSACSAHGGAVPTRSPQIRGLSPADVRPAPMAKTHVLPAGAMHTVKPDSDLQGAGWAQIPGSATQAAAASDGSLWVLSTDPAGPDKYIWHYSNGNWVNIPGLASQLAPAPDGSLYVINSGGGTYHYTGGSWTALGGGAAAITAANDGSIYVVSNDSSRAIWQNDFGTWVYIGGSGTLLAANLDKNTYSVNGGTVGPYGLFVVNSTGGIYYTTGSSGYMQFPGGASAVAPTTGGVFVLAYPASTDGESLYYYDYNSGSWKGESGWGISLSANAQDLYVVSSDHGIYESPLQSSPMSAAPASLSLMGTGSNNMQTFVINGGAGGFAASGYDTGVVSVTTDTIDPSQFDVTPVAAGSTTITITDASGATLAVPVTVTTATGTVN